MAWPQHSKAMRRRNSKWRASEVIRRTHSRGVITFHFRIHVSLHYYIFREFNACNQTASLRPRRTSEVELVARFTYTEMFLGVLAVYVRPAITFLKMFHDTMDSLHVLQYHDTGRHNELIARNFIIIITVLLSRVHVITTALEQQVQS